MQSVVNKLVFNKLVFGKCLKSVQFDSETALWASERFARVQFSISSQKTSSNYSCFSFPKDFGNMRSQKRAFLLLLFYII